MDLSQSVFLYRSIKISLFFMLLFLCGTAVAQIPAFPGAEGYGSYAKGGRGGDIVIVSNLDDSGPGSLRDAVEREGSRTILFEVGGIIDLESALIIEDPYITIAGQTAPQPGITIRGHQLAVQTHDVVVRFIRFRPGDYLHGKKKIEWSSLDAVDIGLEDSDEVHDIIFDHCSFSWGLDENIGIWHQSKNITIQNSIISEGLHYPRLNEQTGKGLLIGMLSDSISVLKNLFAHNYERNPFMNANGHLDFRNNVIYNGGDRVIRFNNGSGNQQTVNLVNNVILEGPESSYSHEVQIRLNSNDIYNGKIYADGNLSDRNPRFNNNNWRMVIDQQSLRPFPPRDARSFSEFPVENTETLPTEHLFNVLKPDIGATLPVRDQVDERIIYDTEHKKGQFIAKPDQLFGWPVQTENYRKIDADSSWRKQYDIDILDPEEANADENKNGYTNLEEFLNATNPYNDETQWQRIGNIAISDFTVASSTGQENDQSAKTGNEPAVMELNYPNPFNSTTHIPFTVHTTADYKLEVINSTGQRMAVLANSTLVPGEYQYAWNASGYPSGVYFIKLSWPRQSRIQKVVLIK